MGVCVCVCVCVCVTVQTAGWKIADGFENQRNISCYSQSDLIMASVWDGLASLHLIVQKDALFLVTLVI